MANEKNVKLTESELHARYIQAASKFAKAKTWQEYLDLADEFRFLDTYKDSAQKYSQCVKAASAPAYRDVTDSIRTKGLEATAQDYREAVSMADAAAREGDVVILSPASTSFDRFANFMERGRVFKEIVNALED